MQKNIKRFSFVMVIMNCIQIRDWIRGGPLNQYGESQSVSGNIRIKDESNTYFE